MCVKLRIVEKKIKNKSINRNCKLYGLTGNDCDYICFWEKDLEAVKELITFIHSPEGQKLKDIITSSDFETQEFGFEIFKVLCKFDVTDDYNKELVYRAFLWS